MGDYREYVSRRVVVVLDGYSIDGTLVRAGKSTLTLEDASIVTQGGGDREIDGRTVVPMVSVEWVQVP